MIEITLPDGGKKEVNTGATPLEIAKDISEGLARNVLCASINNELWDINRPITKSSKLTLHTWNDKQGKMCFWHSSAHLMAEALEIIYPGVKLGIGPAIESGFYYDIDLGNSRKISSDDFSKIEKKMIELAREKNKFLREEISKDKAKAYFKKKGDEYKLELLEELHDGEITFYKQGRFVDLCKGPHIPNTEKIKAIKLLNVAGAYWRGDESRKQMTRVYGVSFQKQKELTEYLELIEEAKKRDHRKLGKEMELFTFSKKVGQGLPLWLPKGTLLREKLVNFLKKAQENAGYLPVISPHIGNKDLYICSGHYEKYGEESFQSIKTPQEGEEFFLKPMNCPHHCEFTKANNTHIKIFRFA